MKLMLGIMTLLMVVTRFPFGQGALHLLDASWALFFLLGRLSMPQAYKIGGFVWLVVLGWGIDVLATGGEFVSSSCMTPAYIGLPLAYGVLFLAGAASSASDSASSAQAVARLVLFMAFGALGAFMVSNLFFYQLSGYFDHMSLVEYAQAVAQYFPAYVLTAQVYLLGWFVLDHLLSLERQMLDGVGFAPKADQ